MSKFEIQLDDQGSLVLVNKVKQRHLYVNVHVESDCPLFTSFVRANHQTFPHCNIAIDEMYCTCTWNPNLPRLAGGPCIDAIAIRVLLVVVTLDVPPVVVTQPSLSCS